MTIHSGTVPPQRPAGGEIWYDLRSNQTYVWTGGRWVPMEQPAVEYKQVFISKDQLAKMKQELTDMSEELGDDGN